jgi:hypothetical protein
MKLINFSHPLTDEQLSQLRGLLDEPCEVLDAPVQFDAAAPFAAQVAACLDAVGLSGAAWQTERLLINPPSYAPIAVVLLAELHGRAGYFPPVVRLRPVPDAVPPQFEVAEIIDLNAVRDQARRRR